MNQYLPDTNICIYFIKGLFDLKSKFKEVGPENCFISEITLAELKIGIAKSQSKERNQKAGIIIDDFDLLIGATAVSFDLTLVTNNTSHFSRVKDIKLEDWTVES